MPGGRRFCLGAASAPGDPRPPRNPCAQPPAWHTSLREAAEKAPRPNPGQANHPAPSSRLESEETRRKPTFLLNGIGDGFLDPPRSHDRRIRVGIIRHGH